ncbi:MAG: metal-dependent transcriptional regulator [Desulfurococcaceae archaeon]|uniref:Manganese transport regulator n=1 Tax=Staphylothermus marinus TaxID=2280 RepID=A0A7C4JLV0_STAMA
MVRKRCEEYLEAIYGMIVSGENPGIRKLARVLGVKPSSVVEYLRKMCEQGYIIYEQGGKINLTARGFRIAQEICRRHKLIKDFLIEIGVPEEIAEKDACYIEHGIHEVTLAKLEEFLEKKFLRTK